ncbi:hypothetical protein RUM8411_00181 [Ruegeria meonggei]|uniref:Inverse autotransporter beta-domain domain-containing protein n=1 Tax=Ruegeria meonggei TaxID=1446476 RepID=A0A1X6Y606_9RHOB|nr:hypothetical protein RUM8411_00181 [Ruegeria meonggei]
MGLGQFSVLFFVAVSIVPSFAAASPGDQPSHQRPAVDGVNGKISGFGNTNSFRSLYGVDGSVSLPLGHGFGDQLDGLVPQLETDRMGAAAAYGVGAHVFWRHPNKGLLGLYGHYGSTDLTENANFRAVGFEAEVYLDRFTLTALVGAEDSRLVNSDVDEFDFGTNVFSSAFLIYYPFDNNGLSIGHRYFVKDHSATIGTEWAFGQRVCQNTSGYTRISYSDNNDTSAAIGVRYYIGKKDKPLIRRHREGDPSQTTILWVIEQAVGDLDYIVEQYREIHGS